MTDEKKCRFVISLLTPCFSNVLAMHVDLTLRAVSVSEVEGLSGIYKIEFNEGTGILLNAELVKNI